MVDLKRIEGETRLEHGMRLIGHKIENRPNDVEWADITDALDLDMHYDSLRKANNTEFGGYQVYKTLMNGKFKDNEIKPRLVVSDIHLPFAIDGWLDFIKDTHKKFGCHEEIIINGDIWDFHNASFHTSETDADSTNLEFEKAKEMTLQLVKAFPKAKVTLGNHDLIIIRKIKELGIDKRFAKTFHEMFDLPKTWELAEDFIVNNVYYRHIGCCGGKDGAINSAISNRMSTVSSHHHANGGCKYVTAPNGTTIFGLNTGALVDDNSYALRYGKLNRFKSTLGCGVVYSDKEAYFVPKTN